VSLLDDLFGAVSWRSFHRARMQETLTLPVFDFRLSNTGHI
jgi:hypothetical protein